MLLFPSPLITQFTLFESSAAENMRHAVDTIQPVCAAVPAHGKAAEEDIHGVPSKEKRTGIPDGRRSEQKCHAEASVSQVI